MQRSRREPAGILSSFAREMKSLSTREARAQLLRCFKENDLLTYASAISFQVFFAIIPLALLGFALLGTLGLSSVWSRDIAPALQGNVSPAVYTVISQTVTHVLHQRELFWATIGALISIWEVSGAIRAVMQVLNRIYGVEETRAFRRRMLVSISLAAAVTVLVLGAVAAVELLPLAAPGVLMSTAGWIVAVLLLALTVALIARFAPSKRRPMRWVSFASVLVVVGWIGASLLYGWYITSVADYGSIFGSLAVVMVTLSYLYIQAIVFLTGLQLDGLTRKRAEGEGREESPEARPRPRALVAAR